MYAVDRLVGICIDYSQIESAGKLKVNGSQCYTYTCMQFYICDSRETIYITYTASVLYTVSAITDFYSLPYSTDATIILLHVTPLLGVTVRYSQLPSVNILQLISNAFQSSMHIGVVTKYTLSSSQLLKYKILIIIHTNGYKCMQLSLYYYNVMYVCMQVCITFT